MKYLSLLLIVGVLLVFGLSAGGQKEAPVGEEVITLTLGTGQPEMGGYIGGMFTKFGEYLEELSDGKIKLKVHYSGSLSANERELAEMVQSGSIDFSEGCTTYILGWMPSAKVFDLPFLFKNAEHYKRVTRGPVGQHLAKEVEDDGILLLGFILPGFRSMFNNERPIYTVEDCKGLKIRSMDSPVYIEMFKALGMLPTPMPSSDLYTALQTGVVDAAENDPASIVGASWHDVMKYYSMDRHSLSVEFLIMNKSKYESLSPDLQKAVREAAAKAIDFQLEYVQEAWADCMKIIEDAGVEINEVTDITPFRERVKHITDEYDKEIGYGLVQMVRDAEPK